MFLADTNVISERRKGRKADPGVVRFFETKDEIYVPVQVIGELQAGVESLRQRGDHPQALRLQRWFQTVLEDYSQNIVDFDLACAKTWGILIGVNEQHQIDKQIAAIALVHDLTVVTRNTTHFAGTGVRLLNPFHADSRSGSIN